MDEQFFEKGMKVRRMVLGDEHVDRAEAHKTELDSDFQRFITEFAWGRIWDRPELTKRERSLITIAILTALGHSDELELHLKASRHTGTSEKDIQEVLLHTAVYAGVPAANHAFKIAKKIFHEPDGK